MIKQLLKLRTFSFCYSPLQRFVVPSRIGGSSKEDLYEIYAGNYENKVLEAYKKQNKKKYGTTIISKPEECQKALEILKKVDNCVAWDTQTIDLDIKNQSPVGHGKILCASFYAGPQYDFGNGPKVFIDNFGNNSGLINNFKQYLQHDQYKKSWHNYGFDRHIFNNHGINVRGFGGDTMHMARLYDPAKNFGQYALSALTKSYSKGIKQIVSIYTDKKIKLYNKKLKQKSLSDDSRKYFSNLIENLQKSEKSSQSSFNMQKVKMENLFARKKILKSGTQGKVYEFPTTLTLHTNSDYIERWVNYSVLDAQSTFFLREALQLALRNQKSSAYQDMKNSWMIYQKYWLPFGQLLTQMEREGFKVNMNHLDSIQIQAIEQIEKNKNKFINFLSTFQDDPNICYFNPSSNMQMQQLLHAPFKVDVKALEKVLIKKENHEEMGNPQLQELIESAQEEAEQEINVKKKVGVRKQILQLPSVKSFTIENKDPQIKKKRGEMQIKGLGIPPLKVTPSGLPSVDDQSLKILVGSPEKGTYGKAYEHFKSIGQEQFGKQISEALGYLMKFRHTQTLLQTFIQPLKSFADKNDRIHCSLNINTQTGRLSSKKPNLQNQPAYSKDVYKIRSAFCAEKGNKLIVADYGQLELRVLAHLTNCQKMIEAFKSGGDFHSRTAIGMFDYIREDLENGKIVLEWDKSKGEAPLPLLKDKYADERKKAKTVNFSIAYGKTAQGFAEDWNCTVAEAKAVIKSWFNDRPEVEKWQKMKQDIAKKRKYTQTLIGRKRRLDKFFSASSAKGSTYGMGLRRAINTPVQGGAADIVIASMVKIYQNQQLKDLKWKLLLQIHDQLILQGPQETADRAFEIVKYCMCHPFQKDLLLQLEVDAKLGDNWYECK